MANNSLAVKRNINHTAIHIHSYIHISTKGNFNDENPKFIKKKKTKEKLTIYENYKN